MCQDQRITAVIDRLSTNSTTALSPGQVYSWEELARTFAFDPNYFSIAGGMISRPDQNALLLITHPGGARSFDYEDYWQDGHLIYTGRGQVGDQRLDGQNGELANNSRTNYVFQAEEAHLLRFLGVAACTGVWEAIGPDRSGRERRIIRFELTLRSGSARKHSSRPDPAQGRQLRTAPHRKGREFDPLRAPAAYRGQVQRATPEETAALQEKANRQHHALLIRLYTQLLETRWDRIREIPGATDLSAFNPEGQRVLFEAKTVSPKSEVTRSRSALSQLLEYRFFYGWPDDKLCIVTNHPISDARIRFLEGHDVAVVYDEGEGLRACGVLAHGLFATTNE